MLTSAHTPVSVSLTVATYAITKDAGVAAGVAIFGGVLSHQALDLLGEHPLGGGKRLWRHEGSHLVLFVAMCLIAGPLWWLIVLAFIGGNLPDLTDKKLGLSFINPKRWTATRHWPCHRPGYTKVQLDEAGTRLFSVVAAFAALIFTVALP